MAKPAWPAGSAIAQRGTGSGMPLGEPALGAHKLPSSTGSGNQPCKLVDQWAGDCHVTRRSPMTKLYVYDHSGDEYKLFSQPTDAIRYLSRCGVDVCDGVVDGSTMYDTLGHRAFTIGRAPQGVTRVTQLRKALAS